MTLTASDDDGAVSVAHDGDLLARYRAVTEASKPGFDVLALPAGTDAPGENLALWAPHDHSWHLGAFFCQKVVDGLNCWESELHAGRDLLHGYATDEGYDVAANGDSVAVEQSATWRRSDDASALLDDEREVTVREPDGAGYLVEWTQTLTARGASRNLSSETLHGHYSGLSLRFARSLAEGRVLLPGDTDVGVTSPPRDVSGPAGRWCDYSGRLDGRMGPGESWRAGVAMFDHPDNGPDPVRWFVMTEPFGFLAANPTWGDVLTLADGESVTWRWAMWVHGGEPDETAVQGVYDGYVSRTA